ncbi:MAG: hypothetical protein HKN16_10755, partial [Saprospiraceae bacterium]|nr:hypothetical protein [Saprospiraceae bacterium]
DMIAHDGIVEVCSFSGLSRIDWGLQNFDTWTSGNSDLTVDAVLCLTKDPSSDLLYVGVSNGFEMQSYDGTQWLDLADIKFSNTAEYDETNETLWVGTKSNVGLFKVKDGTITNFTWSNSDIPSSEIFDLEVDSDGTVWMVIDDKGLVSFDGTSFTQYNSSNSDILSDNPTLISVDPSGNVWIGGFQYNALSRFDGTDWVHFQPFVSDLPNANIRQMKCDSQGDLWMATSTGLVQLEYGPTSTREELNSHIINLWPNPAGERLFLSTSDAQVRYEIYNAGGKKILDGSYDSEGIALNEIRSGQYFISLLNQKNQLIGTQGFMKQ